MSVLGLLTVLGCQPPSSPPHSLTINDPALELKLVLQEPEIVTPIGLAIDPEDALYVLESHTHVPPPDYAGPSFDRVKRGIDTDEDGIPDQWNIFADSIEDGMNISFAAGHGLYVATKNQLLRFQDTDGDGRSDQHDELLRMLEPTEVFDHASIMGVAPSSDGWVYISRGNVGGKRWKVVGTDGSAVGGYGDGGDVFRCRLDGSQLEAVATGFWNPFDLRFSRDGRLLLTDNDPDSRGPNRLIDLVPGGNYGYQALYGPSGLHPYLAWNGELPGTLPYAAPLGEAPCGLLDANLTNFGEGYANQVLVSIWEENNIVRIPLSPHGSTVVGEPEVLIQGDETFHPVSMVANSRGDVYLSDWVARTYPNHGEGKIWLIRSKDGAVPDLQPAETPLIHRTSFSTTFPSDLLEQLVAGDAFEQAQLRHQLARSGDPDFLMRLLAHEEAELRLQGLLTFQERSDELPAATLEALLRDPDHRLRRMCLIYIGTHTRSDMKPALDQALINGLITPELVETFLATQRHVQPEFVRMYKAQSEAGSRKLPRELPEGYLTGLIADARIDEATRALALPYLGAPQEHEPLLLDLLKQATDLRLQQALLNALKGVPSEAVGREMLAIATRPTSSDELKALALSTLAYQGGNFCEEVRQLLQAGSTLVQYAAVKYLCRCSSDEATTQVVNAWIRTQPQLAASVTQAWAMCTGDRSAQPGSPEAWMAAVNEQGDPAIGRMVFSSPNALCQTCHKVDGWGSDFGPDLSNIGRSKTPQQLMSAILHPSQEMAPEWQGWYVVDKDGNAHYGRQIDVHEHKVELMNAQGEFDTYKEPQDFGVSERSLMPEGLQLSMTAEEFNGLIAYLRSLQ